MKRLSLRSAQALVVTGMLVALMLLGLEANRVLREEYRQSVASIVESADRTANQLAMRTAEVFDRVNQSTLLVQYMRDTADARGLAGLAESGVVNDDAVQAIYVADMRGLVVEATNPHVPASVADESFFKRHRDDASVDVDIAPVWTDELTGRSGIPVTRRLSREGVFDGIVTAIVDPAALSVDYAQHQDPGTVIAVAGADGRYRSRVVDGRLSFGEKVDLDGAMARLAEARRTGVPGRSPVDGVARFSALAKVDRYPMYALVAVDADVALRSYYDSRMRIASPSLFAAIAVLLAGGLLLPMARRLDASTQRTLAAEASLRATLDGSMDAVVILKPIWRPAANAGEGAAASNSGSATPAGSDWLDDLHVVDCNENAAHAMGTTRDRMVGRRVCEVMPAMRTAGYLKHFAHAIRSRRRMSAEILALHDPVVGRWLHHQIIPLDDGVALITRDITEHKEDQAALERLARIDALTGALNRRAFEQALEAAMARARRSGATLAMLNLDLDGFKGVNDTMGHAAGDAVLKEVARRLNDTVRATDTVARLGGDEFAVILEGAGTQAQVTTLGSLVLEVLKAPHALDGSAAFVPASVGVAVMRPGESAEAFANRADHAMYAAKAAGKAQIRWSADDESTDEASSDGAGERATHDAAGHAARPTAPAETLPA